MTDVPQPNSLSPALREQLARAPFAVFLSVSAADGTIDRKEVARFEDVFASPAFAIIRNHLADQPISAQTVIADLLRPETDLHQELNLLSQDLDRALLPTDAAAIKQALWQLGHEVARASGGNFLGLGNKVSPQEQVALDALRLCLGLEDMSQP